MISVFKAVFKNEDYVVTIQLTNKNLNKLN